MMRGDCKLDPVRWVAQFRLLVQPRILEKVGGVGSTARLMEISLQVFFAISVLSLWAWAADILILSGIWQLASAGLIFPRLRMLATFIVCTVRRDTPAGAPVEVDEMFIADWIPFETRLMQMSLI
jgi:hypothetical protein